MLRMKWWNSLDIQRVLFWTDRILRQSRDEFGPSRLPLFMGIK